MYYLRTKSAVDAIKFTLNNDKKAEPLPVVEVAANSVEMTAEEYRTMIEMAKNAGPDDCEMCGS
jgi:ribonucleoside-diphosphate reductase alpha chain